MAFVRRLSALLLLLVASVGLATPVPAAPASKPLTVHFFDVGQGDAALIISPTGKTVLIDGGPPEAGTRLARRLRELVTGPVDLVILTHPHLDHLGGLTKAIQAVGARRFMDPGFDHPGETYRDLLTFVGKSVGQVMVPTPNPQAPETLLTVGLGEGVTLTILWPRRPQEPFLKDTRSDANSNSIIAKLTYGKTAFLFTGDAEPDTEAALLRKNIDLSSSVLKVAHHGGKHSSTKAFLEAVKPQIAIISCGAGNDYGHPTSEALERLAAARVRVLRTDKVGEVVATSDGVRVALKPATGNGATESFLGEVKPGPVALGPILPSPLPGTVQHASGTLPEGKAHPEVKGASGSAKKGGARYVSLKGSKVFHRGECSTLERSKSERLEYRSREAALKERRPAEDCDP